MRRTLSSIALFCGFTVLAAGCDNLGGEKEDSPAEAAQNALDIEAPDETAKEVETQRSVDVVKETTVVDKQTGEVLSHEKEVTPVTVTKEKEVDTDVNVNVGETNKAPQ